MKILISPSKTQNYKVLNQSRRDIPFPQETDRLFQILKGFTKEAMSVNLHVKGGLLDQTYQQYQQMAQAERIAARDLYTGIVFKQLHWSDYTAEQLAYAEGHLRVLSAFYGVLTPYTGVKPYRLDMKGRVLPNHSLYPFWQDRIAEYFANDEEIINLASTEFSKMVKKPIINVSFMEDDGQGKCRVISTYAKMARGMMLDYLILHQVKTVAELKGLAVGGYRYNAGLSSEDQYTFVRKQ